MNWPDFVSRTEDVNHDIKTGCDSSDFTGRLVSHCELRVFSCRHASGNAISPHDQPHLGLRIPMTSIDLRFNNRESCQGGPLRFQKSPVIRRRIVIRRELQPFRAICSNPLGTQLSGPPRNQLSPGIHKCISLSTLRNIYEKNCSSQCIGWATKRGICVAADLICKNPSYSWLTASATNN